ncbi:MAG: hypothetical protein J6W96_01335 [Alphaproteobacteria bacterium]|nr:hypothetical protein [Alphaproteobacteria bacterium]
MIGTTEKEFYEQLYYGSDIEMKDNKWYYMIYSAYLETGEHSIRVWKYDSLGNDAKISEELYNHVSQLPEQSIELFKKSKIFNGKSFLEIEKNMEILSM